MVKALKQKKKRTIFLIWLSSSFILTCLVISLLSPTLTLYLALNTFPFLSSLTGSKAPFYGENIDMSQILPTSKHYIVNSKGQDLIDIAAELGINLIRITNGQSSFTTQTDSLYTHEQWNQVLDKMQNKGIKAIIQIEISSNNGDYYTPDIRPIYLDLVQKYIASEVFSHPDVYAVDLKNEPLLTDANLSMLQAAHALIKAQYPNLKQTIGWWATAKQPQDPYNPNNYNWSDFSAGQKIAKLVDFYSIHMYGLSTTNFGLHLSTDLKTKMFLSQVENGLHTTKPILIEEFGEANGDAVSDQDSIGNPQLQANVYQGVYQALKEIHSKQLLGSVAFDFYSRNQYPDAWALVKNNGNYLFPAAYILQEYALGKNNPSLQADTIVSSNSYLLTNADNYTQKSIHLSDRIGLKLQLDPSKNYTLSLSVDKLLQPLDLLHYNSVSHSYYAVYQAKNRGTVQLTLLSDAPCPTAPPPCATPVYALMITVQ